MPGRVSEDDRRDGHVTRSESIGHGWKVALSSIALGGAGYAGAILVSSRLLPPLGMACVPAAAVLITAYFFKKPAPATSTTPHPDPHEDIFRSAGPMIIGIGLDGSITHMNPAAERLLGYHACELVGTPRTAEILAEGEAPRVIGEMQRMSGRDATTELTPEQRLRTLMEIVGSMPPSQVPTFEAQFRRKGGATFPVALHLSALRGTDGAMEGMVVVALDLTATHRQEQAARESQERYRDLFESSSEMIATLSTTGKFLYANPAWKRCFGLSPASLLQLSNFCVIFGPDRRGEVSGLFSRALKGEMIDRVPLRDYTEDGRVVEFEISLSRRQRAGIPLAVRCLLRDVTQQRQREHRLALQLVVSQILGDNASSDTAALRILEALCRLQDWDLAVKWEVNPSLSRLEFSTAWGIPGTSTENIIQESMSSGILAGESLPGKAWQEGRSVWEAELETDSNARSRFAAGESMKSGWAVPVRVGSRVLAVLEFYSHRYLREDKEALAAIDTVAGSLGQMLARAKERDRAEELSRRQQVLLDSVADGICGIDRHGFVSFANPAAARLLGAPINWLVGKSAHELLHGDAPAGEQCGDDCALRRATSRPLATGGEETLYRADGASVPVEYFITPMLEQGRYRGSVMSFRDISQRHALDRMKDEFISTVSHELRTPLTSIRGALGLLTSGILGQINDKAANLLRIAVTNSDRLVRLINDILDLERIQSGREPITFRPMQLSDVIKQAMDGMQPVADAAGVQLVHETTPVEITADPDRLLQVMTNLLSNAIKFSPPNSSVSVMIRPGGAGVMLSVIDQGRGIPADKLEAIFGRFQQVDASDSRQKGGSGLGLAICRSIVTQHSGRIWAERNPVRGSTFRVYLPYKQVPMTAAPASDLLSHGTVLLADANGATRPMVMEKLARHGYRVVEATTVEQTLSASADGVEAILLDTTLDGMNGWEILPMLRHADPHHRVPIVLLSLGTQGPDLPGDPEGWVPKPIEEDSLLKELARVLCGPGETARVLVIEDDHDLALVISDVFGRHNIEVKTAHTLQTAIDGCASFQPHLVVLDIGLPDGDGFNVVEWLRKHERLNDLPLVVYSGREFTPEERRQLTLGPTHFLTKARVQPHQLEALVLTLLRNSRQMEEAPPYASTDRQP